MNKKRNPIHLLLPLLLILTVLAAGCGATPAATASSSAPATSATASESESAAAVSETPAETPAESAMTLEPVEIQWYVVGTEPLEKTLVEEDMSAQIKDRLNATVSLNWIDWGNYGDKLNILLSSGDNFDLCFTANWMGFGQNAAKGAFLDLKPLLEKTPALKTAVPDNFWQAVTVKGKILAVPNIQPTSTQLGAIVNKAMAEKYGFVDKIKSEADLMAYVDAVVEGEKDNKDIQPWNFRAMTFSELYGKYEIMPVNDFAVIDMKGDGAKVVNPFEMEAFKVFLKEQRDLFNRGLIRKDILAYSKNGEQKEADGKAGKSPLGGFGDYGPNMLNPLRKVLGTPGETIYYDIGIKKYLGTGNIQATMTAVNTSASNPERALMLLELINTDQKLYTTMCFGVEGTHFTLESDRLVQTEAGKSNYNPGTNWMFGMTKNAYFRQDDPQWLIDMIPEWDVKNVVPSPVLGFSFDSEPVKTELSMLQTVIDEYYSALCYGVLDPDEQLPVFLSKLKDAGLDKVVTETQAQIDAWRASN